MLLLLLGLQAKPPAGGQHVWGWLPLPCSVPSLTRRFAISVRRRATSEQKQAEENNQIISKR